MIRREYRTFGFCCCLGGSHKESSGSRSRLFGAKQEYPRLSDQPLTPFKEIPHCPLIVVNDVWSLLPRREALPKITDKTSKIKCQSCTNMICLVALVVSKSAKQVIHSPDIEFEYQLAGFLDAHGQQQEHEVVGEYMQATCQNNARLHSLGVPIISFKLALSRRNPDSNKDRHYRANGLKPCGDAILVRPHRVTSERKNRQREKRKAPFHPPMEPSSHFRPSIFWKAS